MLLIAEYSSVPPRGYQKYGSNRYGPDCRKNDLDYITDPVK